MPGKVLLRGRHMGLKRAMGNKRWGQHALREQELQQVQGLELQQPSWCEETVTTEVKGEITVSLRTVGRAHKSPDLFPGGEKGRKDGRQAGSDNAG